MAPSLLRGRVDADRRTIVLAAGDAAMIALFVLLGELRHSGTVAAGVGTFGQFALAWALVAVVAGAYTAEAVRSPSQAALWGLGTWIVAALVGQLVRLLVRQGAIVQPTFLLVTIAFGGLFIGGWRFVAARYLT